MLFVNIFDGEHVFRILFRFIRTPLSNDEDQSKIQEGLMLFAEYYGYLWV